MSRASQPRKPTDTWYVRLPDGQVIRARSTEAVRHHVRTGRIPRNSQVRRAPDEEWTALEWTREFTAAVASATPHPEPAEEPLPHPSSSPEAPLGIAGRLDPLRLQTVGVRGLGEELLAALDSTLVRGKLVIGGLAGLLLALSATGLRAAVAEIDYTGGWLTALIVVLAVLIILAVAGALIARWTYVELSRLRPARWVEVTHGLRPVMARLVFLGLLGPGVAVGVILLWRWGLGELAAVLKRSMDPAPAEVLLTSVTTLGILLEIVCWVVVGVGPLFWPVAVTEEAGVFESYRLWLRLLREHRGRAILFEALALVAGGLMALPFALPVALATQFHPGLGGNLALMLVRNCLFGLAAAPLFAYLMVANVFIYLYLRYEAQE